MSIDYRSHKPELYQAMHELQERLDGSGIDRALLEMLKLRASQINGCSFCVQLHSSEARRQGVPDERLHMVAAWRYANSFTAAEKAALAWCESITRLSELGPPERELEDLRVHYSDEQIVALTWAVAAINAWNRIAVPLGRHGGPPPPASTA